MEFGMSRVLATEDQIIKEIHLNKENRVALFNDQTIYLKIDVKTICAPARFQLNYFDNITNLPLEKS